MNMTYKGMKSLLKSKGALDALDLYRNKYFSLWMTSRHFKGLTKDQERFLMKSLYSLGSVAAFIIEDTKKEPSLVDLQANNTESTLILENKNSDAGVLCLVPYATSQWNINDAPSIVTYISKRGAQFIPQGPKVVNKDCVIIWAHASHKPVAALIDWYIERIADIETTISMNLFAHKLPRLVVVAPEDEARVKNLVDAIDAGETKIFLSASDIDAIKNVLDGGGTYIIDKLHQYKQNVENELLTLMGINNTPHEKAERLITDEANSNNQLISTCGDCFKDVIDQCCEDVREILGYEITQEVKEIEKISTNNTDILEKEGEEE